MAEDWIRTLADRIRNADSEAALAEEGRSRDIQFIQSHGPSFFEEVLTAVQKHARALLEFMGKDPTAGSIAFTRLGDTLNLTRPAFPYFEGRLSLDAGGQAVRLIYVKENPKRSASPPAEIRQTFRFTRAEGNTLVVESDSGVQALRFENPAELAKHITETLFLV